MPATSDPFHAAAGFTGGKKRVPPESKADQKADFQADLGTWDEGCDQQTMGKSCEQIEIRIVTLISTYEKNTCLAGGCINFSIDSKR